MEKRMIDFQRGALGILCGLLPVLSVGFGLVGSALGVNAPKWWWSVSATYYANSGCVMVSLLAASAVFFLSYRGHDWKDRAVTLVSGISALGVIIFPCATAGAGEYVGLFALPVNVSHAIHCVCAGILFSSFAVMILCLFTKTENDVHRNIFIACGGVIVLFMGVQCITSYLGIGWFTLINESFMLIAFSVAWLVKGEFFENGIRNSEHFEKNR